MAIQNIRQLKQVGRPDTNFRKSVRQANQQSAYESMEGVNTPPAIAMANKEYGDMLNARATAESRYSVESGIQRQYNPNDYKTINYLRNSNEQDIATADNVRDISSQYLNSPNYRQGAQSALRMLGESRGVSTGLTSMYNNAQIEQARMLSGGGMWGEISAGFGKSFGYMDAAREYSKMYSGGDR